MRKVRCAIYTRKSSEEGLEQDFNSLHAQREACAAYILSHASEGWSLLDEEYDDGGLSGGTLERPALQRLLTDIEVGKVDIVVVYKVDRLTRSLIDFAKLVETMDKAEVSFVSVTQSFNTTNSMGRLTLNMLLSFAQFEREVTAERIRDKIAASKAKGMWMGGVPPIGYEPDGRSLKIVEEHASLVREVFALYLELGNVRLVAEQMREQEIHSPRRVLATGREIGGGPLTRGQIYKLLANPVYLGEIHHKGQVYDGKHEPIVDRATWDRVQAMLAANLQGEERKSRTRSPSLLAGSVFDEHGEPLVASHACKGKVRYRYYVSRSLQHAGDEHNETGIRIPASELEGAVTKRVAEALRDPITLLADAGLPIEAGRLPSINRTCAELAEQVSSKDRRLLNELVERIVVRANVIEIALSGLALLARLGYAAEESCRVVLKSEVKLSRSGRALRLVQADGKPATLASADPGLVQLLVRARKWWARLSSGEADIATIARDEKVNDSWISRVVRLNFLAPAIVDAILSGSQPIAVSAATLRSADLPTRWDEQLAYFNM
ncbi:recombinase family protein [Erythrobacteraceae bacterium WH01K]|nr:recombinase family protein [Erythrobacteraceae bacterium WH01K]